MEPRQPKTQSARIEELEIRLRHLEGGSGRTRSGRGFVARIVPPEAQRHFKAAGREQLLGMRALVDHWIKRMGEDEAPRTGEREEIPIE